MQNENQPIVVNLPEGQNTLTLLQGKAPEQLDQLAPIKVDISGTIDAPLRWLEKRINDIDQHKAHVLVDRDHFAISLLFNESDPYNNGRVDGVLLYSAIFKKFGINTDRGWEPEELGQFLKLNRVYFVDQAVQRDVVNALKSFHAKVDQTVQRESKENGNRAFSFQQAVNSNIPASFHLRIPVFCGMPVVDIEVETYAQIDGSHVTIALQSAGANDIAEEVRSNTINDLLDQIREIAPELVIIEQ